jgi:hypothetical protein
LRSPLERRRDAERSAKRDRGNIWCHWLKEDAYTSVRDDTGYNVAES